MKNDRTMTAQTAQVGDTSVLSPMERPRVNFEGLGTYNEDLAWILREFRQRMHASGVVVTIHYNDGRPPEIEAAASEDGPAQDALRSLTSIPTELPHNLHTWHEPTAEFPWHAMTISLASNHCSRVVVSALYAAAEATERTAKEFVAERFQPVLTGYFKLWLLHRSTSRRLETIIAALAPIDFGVIVLDPDAKILFENPAAVTILDERSALHRCRGSVCASDRIASVKLRVAIDEALSAKHNGGDSEVFSSTFVFIKAPKKPAPIVAAVSAVQQAATGENDNAAIIHVFDPSSAVDQLIAPVCVWYNFSPVETRLVTMLVAGGTVPEIAIREDIKPETVRTYLKNVFRKTETKSQADLVRAMLTSSVRLRTSKTALHRPQRISCDAVLMRNTIK